MSPEDSYRNFDQVRRSAEAKVNLGLVNAAGEIDRIVRAISGRPDWGALKGRKVFDIGCGSRLTPRGKSQEGWPPYFCLLCAGVGAMVTGLDLYNPDLVDAGKYRHLQMDVVSLVAGKKLAMAEEINLPQMQVVHASNLVRPLASRDLDASLDRVDLTADEFETMLFIQVQDALREGALFCLDGRLYKKVGIGLEEIRK